MRTSLVLLLALAGCASWYHARMPAASTPVPPTACAGIWSAALEELQARGFTIAASDRAGGTLRTQTIVIPGRVPCGHLQCAYRDTVHVTVAPHGEVAVRIAREILLAAYERVLRATLSPRELGSLAGGVRMPVNAGAVGAVAAAVAVPITMRALARLFPASPAPRETALTFDELRSRYKSWELGLGFGALLGAVPFAFLFWLALRAVAAAHAALLPPAELVWVAAPFFWSIPAMFLGLVAMFPVGRLLARRLLADRYAEYVVYQQLKSRMDVEKVARILGTVVSLAAAVFVLLGLDWSVRADREGLTLNRFLSIGEECHAWADVRGVRTAPALVAPNGNRVARREYVVRFADGRSWSTNGDLSDASPAEKRRLAALVSEHSGVAIEEVRIFRNDEL